VFITGGVLSSLGKGVAGASLGSLFKGMGYAVSMQKLDPYLNTDAGTMNPLQHGEVYVTDDGAETDMDLGHYERLLDIHLPEFSCFTSGFIYASVIEKEREGSGGEYQGKTIQIVPHVTDMIKHMILRQSLYGARIIMVEIGGTVGDIEGLPFLEAVQELRSDLPPQSTLSIHLTYLPYLRSSGETKTKPTQHSVKELRRAGLRPDIIICRGDEEMTADTKDKIAKTCGLKADSVFDSKHLDYIYMLPEHFAEQGLAERACGLLGLEARPYDIAPIRRFTSGLRGLKKKVRIAVVGKYVDQESRKPGREDRSHATYYESYKSVVEALTHAGVRLGRRAEIVHIEADDLGTPELRERELGPCEGVLVPGGFGDRGYENMLEVIRFARERGKPFFGICFGLQLAVVEYARHVLGMGGATSEEFREDPTSIPEGGDLVYFMESWYSYKLARVVRRSRGSKLGGTMRLGLQPCFLAPGTRAFEAYGHAWDEGRKLGAQGGGVYLYDQVPLHEGPLVFTTAFSPDIDLDALKGLGDAALRDGRATVYERHRHRFEINPRFHRDLTAPAEGRDRFVISGEAPAMTAPGEDTPPSIAEVMELESHPWFLGCQFHPEFLSRPLRPHPLFLGFVRAAAAHGDRARKA
jgi:CTP synthase